MGIDQATHSAAQAVVRPVFAGTFSTSQGREYLGVVLEHDRGHTAFVFSQGILAHTANVEEKNPGAWHTCFPSVLLTEATGAYASQIPNESLCIAKLAALHPTLFNKSDLAQKAAAAAVFSAPQAIAGLQASDSLVNLVHAVVDASGYQAKPSPRRVAEFLQWVGGGLQDGAVDAIEFLRKADLHNPRTWLATQVCEQLEQQTAQQLETLRQKQRTTPTEPLIRRMSLADVLLLSIHPILSLLQTSLSPVGGH